jgi:hypothetical protein
MSSLLMKMVGSVRMRAGGDLDRGVGQVVLLVDLETESVPATDTEGNRQ